MESKSDFFSVRRIPFLLDGVSAFTGFYKMQAPRCYDAPRYLCFVWPKNEQVQAVFPIPFFHKVGKRVSNAVLDETKS